MRSLILSFFFIFLARGLQSQECFPHGKVFSYQADIDAYKTNHPDCTIILGDLLIGKGYGSESDITDLSGLGFITEVKGNLIIYDNDDLQSLEGLNSITSIGNQLQIHHNRALTSLDGLRSLTTLGGDKYLIVASNPSLKSLSGLGNIRANSIRWLIMSGNTSLASCAVESICCFLPVADPEYVHVFSNGPGCNTPEEILDQCERSESRFSIYPNPVTTSLYVIAYAKGFLKIFNSMGMLVMEKEIFGQDVPVDVSKLGSGLYVATFEGADSPEIRRFLKF